MAELGRRRFLVGAAATGAATLLGGPMLLRRPGAVAAPPLAPHVQFGADSQRSMAMSWSTAGDVTGAALDVGIDDTFGRVLGAETRAVVGHAPRYHHVAVDGLEPDTTYHYRLRHDGGEAVAGTFRTAPATGVPFTVAAFGDQGTGERATAVQSVIAGLQPAFVFHVGDLCYADPTGGLVGPGLPLPVVDQATWDQWLAAIAPIAATVPWMVTVGNHEMESGMGELGYDGVLARFSLPGNGAPGVPTTWSTRYGNLAVVGCDGNDASLEIARNRDFTGGAQDAWLDTLLASLRADPSIDWIVVGFHNCMYCTNALHASDGGNRDRWEAMFDRHGVDVVINGHNHCYERAHPLRGGAVVEELGGGATFDSARGTTYLTAGGGGQTGYPLSLAPLSYVTIDGGVRVPETALWSAYRYNDNSLVALDIVPPDDTGTTSLGVRAFSSGGAVLDTLTLTRATALGSPSAPSPIPATIGAPTLPATGHRTAPAVGAGLAAVALAARAAVGSH